MSVSEAWFHRLKAAQRDLIRLCGGIERAVDISSVSKSQIGRFNNPTDPDIMPLPVVIALEADCGQPIVTTALAGINGRRLSDPEEERAASQSVIAAFAEKQRAQADTSTEVALALADGVFTPAELRAADRKAAEEQVKISDFRASIARALAQGGVKASLSLVSEG